MKSVKSYVVDLFARGQTHSYCFSLWLLRETLEMKNTYFGFKLSLHEFYYFTYFGLFFGINTDHRISTTHAERKCRKLNNKIPSKF